MALFTLFGQKTIYESLLHILKTRKTLMLFRINGDLPEIWVHGSPVIELAFAIHGPKRVLANGPHLIGFLRKTNTCAFSVF